MATHAVAAARRTFRELHGVVVSAGLMQKTVKVRVGGRKWNDQVQKYFDKPQSFLVHDPNDSLRTGDVVAITSGWRTSRNKRHVVKHIIAPAQVPIEERPPVPTEEERWAEALAQREAKVARRAARDAGKLQQERPRDEQQRRQQRQGGDAAAAEPEAEAGERKGEE